MSHPKDEKLWNKVKSLADKIYSKPSAYKSGFMVKKYKELGGKFKDSNNQGLKRWFAEEWKNQHGKVGYQHANDIYRPTIRVNKDTPKTWNEIPKEKIDKAKIEKVKTGRVKKF